MQIKRTVNLWLVASALISAHTLVSAPSYGGAMDAQTIASSLQHPSYDTQLMVFTAIDSGDISRIKSHVNFVRSFLLTNPNAHAQMNLEFTDAAGNTPLIRAALLNKLEIVNFLIQAGVNINATNLKNETALIASYNAGHFDVAKTLLAHGAEDPYQAALLIKQYEASLFVSKARQMAIAKDSAATDSLLYTMGSVAAGGTLVGVGARQIEGGSTSSATGGSTATNGATIDCGAGAGIHPEACDSTLFRTTEASPTGYQSAVVQMKADHAYAHGYDGRIFNRNSDGTLVDDEPDGHVIVGVVDTGTELTHPELDSNILTNLAVTCNSVGVCSAGGTPVSGSHHGTYVAGTIAAERNENGTGMHGIAPEAHLIIVQAGSDSGLPLYSTSAGIKYATDNGAQVINNSWGTDTSITAITAAEANADLDANGGAVTARTAYQNVVDNHAIIVFSAANDSRTQPSFEAGLPYYFQGANPYNPTTQASLYANYNIVNPTGKDWSQNWVAAMAVASDNTPAYYSNYCGVAKDWCLAAPGGDATKTYLYTTDVGSSYEGWQGTSAAAPNISGAIAVMLGAFPQLDPEDVLQILFDTATDLGATGVDEVYGHGLVDLQKATDPTTGGWVLSVGSFSRGAPVSTPVSGSGVGLSPAFGNQIIHSGATLMFLDAYGKDYTIPLSLLYSRLERREKLYDRYAEWGKQDFVSNVQLGEKTTLGFTPITHTSTDPTRDSGDTGQFSLQTYGKGGLLAGASYHADLATMSADSMPRQYVASGAYENPYLRLVDNAASTMAGFVTGDFSTRFVAYVGDANQPYTYHYGTTKNANGVYSEMHYQPQRGSMLSVNNGVLVEQNSMLGSETSGAFTIDKSTTYHAGFAGTYAISDDISLLAQYNMGMTQISAADSSLFTDFSAIFTNAFALGAEMRRIANDADTLGFVFSQPLRVSSGNAQLTLPMDVGANKQVLFGTTRMGLAPTDREFDLEGYYHYKLGKKSELGLNSVFRIAPDNNSANANDATFLAKYKYQIGL